jgi:hypothetical protein
MRRVRAGILRLWKHLKDLKQFEAKESRDVWNTDHPIWRNWEN